MPQPERLDRIVLRDPRPEIPGRGRAKAIVGFPTPIEITAFRDGHGIIAARARWRLVDGSADRSADGSADWSSAPLAATIDDRFVGTATFDRIGPHELIIEAWTDRYACWRRDLVAWRGAGEPVAVELEVGAEILTDLLPLVGPADRQRVCDAISTLGSVTCADRVRIDAGLDDAVVQIIDGVADPHDLTSTAPIVVRVERERAAIGSWYEFFPRSEGGFAPSKRARAKVGGATRRLDAIAAMGFDVVYLPPIHPVGRSHRKGRNNSLVAGPTDPGSPWAIGSADGGHTSVEPSLGTIDDVDSFIARATELGLEVALDYALQCSPDHPWITEHPEWFAHRPDGSIRYAENPPKKYQDIHPLDFWPPRERDRVALWNECLAVLRFWMERGVRIFRVDNPHTKPVEFWDWLLGEVAATDPDVVFLAEAFTHPAMMNELAEVGFSQGYTYFTWRHTAAELAAYLDELSHGAGRDWFRPNLWPTTPDILTGALRGGSAAVFAQRAIVAALASPSWGIYSGYELCEHAPAADKEEYDDSEKYRLVKRRWNVTGSLVPLLTRLNAIRDDHPAFADLSTTRIVHTTDPRVLAWTRTTADGADPVLVIVNCEPDHEVEAGVTLDVFALGLVPDGVDPNGPGRQVVVSDELTGESWDWHHGENYVRLGPDRVAHVLALGRSARD